MPQSTYAVIELDLPLPPSVNALYANRKGGRGKGRYRTRRYESWLAQADRHFLMQKRSLPRKPITGQLKIEILIPANTRGDASNYIKASEDFLVSREITGDDKGNWEVSIKRDNSITCCRIKISQLTAS